MSKSNLKNINKFNTSKIPYILYLQSNYSNLLYKLQKSCSWNINKNFAISKIIKKVQKNTNTTLITDLDDLWMTQIFLKQTHLKYNPNGFVDFFKITEVVSYSNYRYVDIDILRFFEKLNKMRRRKLRQLQIHKQIFGKK